MKSRSTGKSRSSRKATTRQPAKNQKAGAQRRRQLATHYAARYRAH